ncbi:MAG: MarR family transcriptional regulator [Alphaproteobacteria bacterium HGW-Alphaproteobacteria-13]|jgi:DNA-binding MarR family transcriptional regulator|nr:MAG: MarR family transcriptional regulator [Alphaproteobacteria bacterium HGW-Alphaproteobacteria-13]
MAAKKLNLDNFLPYRLSVASYALSSRIAVEYQNRFGLKNPEWRLLTVLGDGRSRTQRELVAATRMDKVTVNRAARTLADRQLIARQAHEADGRSHHLELTQTGRSLYEAIVPAALASEARLESAITAAERAALMTILAKLTTAAENHG